VEEIIGIFKKTATKRVFIFAILIFILYLLRSILNIILLTFIISFLINGLERFISRKIKMNRKITVLLLYIIAVSGLTYGIVKYLPVLVNEITQIVKQMTDFFTNPANADNVVLTYIMELVQQYDITSYFGVGLTLVVDTLNNISAIGLQLFIALILSLFFLLEKERIISFTSRFKQSKISSFYNELEFFGKKFVGTFGKVIEAQFIIALVNMAITTFFLWIMGYPHLFGLAIMVFFLGLIPVAGVIISLVPLCIIGYSVGGFIQVVYLLVMIAVVHAIEAYILNPKLMSSKTNLPVFYTFVVLIFGEHFFGVWGLILGIPVFVFILDVLGVYNLSEKSVNKKP
jgi:predicted PurR-regulated permease PerM